MSSKRLARLIFCACSLLMLIELAGVWLTRQPDTSLRRLFIAVAPAWTLLAMAGSAYVQLALSWRITWHTWRLRLPLHGAAALVLAIGVLAVDTLIQQRPGDTSFLQAFGIHIHNYLANAFVMTLAFVVMVHALIAYETARRQEEAQRELAESLAAARLDAERSRSDEHFMMDALDRIARMAVGGDQRRVADVIGAFGEVLRAALERDPARMGELQQELLLELDTANYGSSAAR